MELQSSYRTYRPQKWADVAGQELIVRTLTNEIAHESLVHAYLFTGTRGVGKTTTARLLAKTVNCEKRKKGETEPCNTCSACVSITEGRSLDVMEIDAASHTGVDNVRENIIAASRVASFERTMKVFIIVEVHMLSTAAFNALLKTLEEPSANVLFILATTDSDRVPETIISRCQRFDFRRVSPKDIQKRLLYIAKQEGVTVEPAVLATLVRYAEGSLRDAESTLGQLLGLGKKSVGVDDAALVLPQGDSVRAQSFVDALLAYDAHAALKLVDDFVDRGGDTRMFLLDCIRIGRQMLIHTVTQKGVDHQENALAQLLRSLLRAAADADVVDPPELALELLIAEYTASHRARHVPSPIPEQKSVAPETPKIIKEKIQVEENGLLSLIAINDRWNHVLAAAKKYNHSLALILKVATPVSIEAHTITLGFRYSFHADRLEDHATKKLANRVLEEVFALPLIVRTAIVPHSAPPVKDVSEEKEESGTLLSSLLTTFGGKVIKKTL